MTAIPSADGTSAGPIVTVVLELIPDSAVIAGTLHAPNGTRRDFHGWIELAAALEALRPKASPTKPRAG